MNLKEASGRIGVDHWFFDLDDTLIPTSWVFEQQMQAYAQFVSDRMGSGGTDRVWEGLKRVNNEVYKEMAVNPKRWEEVVSRLAGELGEPAEEFVAGLNILGQIYDIRLAFHAGAEGILKGFSEAGLPMGIVTHANAEWTRRKIGWLGLTQYVALEDVYIVNEDKHKGPEDWGRAMERRGFDPVKTGVVGDSLPGDIIAAHRAGVRRKFYVPSPWSVYSQGEVPQGTEVLDKISGLIPAIYRLIGQEVDGVV